jgi:penicillin-binding protein 1C
MGNLDQTPTDGVTGSTGPALLLRGIFAELTRNAGTRPLYLSPRLVRAHVCVPLPPHGPAAEQCVRRAEWFLPGTAPAPHDPRAQRAFPPIRLSRPTPGLELALDPRLPPDAQAFEFAVNGVEPDDRVLWNIDGRTHTAEGSTYRWALAKGDHRVAAMVWRGAERLAVLREVEFRVR